jgi:hypothetical protein
MVNAELLQRLRCRFLALKEFRGNRIRLNLARQDALAGRAHREKDSARIEARGLTPFKQLVEILS